MATTFVRWGWTVAWAIALPMAAQASDAAGVVSRETGIAVAHAGMALGAADLKTVHAHLQHVVNCLVGPSGAGYDAQQGDPCKGMGQGAIVDANGDANRTSQLQSALADAMDGLKATTVDEAHTDARRIMSTLQAK